MAKGKQRIATDGGDSLAGENPFGALNMGDLPNKPLGTSVPSKESSKSKSVKKTRVEIRRLKAGKGGKVVTEIAGLHVLGERDLEKMLKTLKQGLGSGGTLKSGVIELQGDKRDAVESFLQAEGYRPVRTGG